jgi:hypothetical protein
MRAWGKILSLIETFNNTVSVTTGTATMVQWFLHNPSIPEHVVQTIRSITGG